MTSSKSIIIIFSVFLILFWTSLANEGLTALPAGGDSPYENHAFIIGIGDYKNWPKLESPVKDAEELAKILLEKYDFKKSNVTVLTDKTKEKPTLLNILTYLEGYTTQLTAKDNLMIFFSGHSAEDDKGETYWVPVDGKKKTKMTWLSHTSLCVEVFASKDFKVKSLLILTDTPFSSKLIKPRPISLSPFDLRYPEKITEKAESKSREVLAFGEQHWPGSKNTDNMGLFAYYIRKGLAENELDVIDFENLLFDENVLFPISKIAGTKLVRGRIRTPQDEDGQFIVARVMPQPVVNILSASISPEKGYPGDSFTVKATTSDPAYRVYIDIDGKKQEMKGSGTEWTFSRKIEKLGDTKFYLAAINQREIEGKKLPGIFTTIKPKAKVANVTEISFEPKSGLGGDSFRFTATTNEPAKEVVVNIKGKPFKMKGADTQWSLSKKIDDIGTVDFAIIATNDDGIQGSPKDGNILVTAGIANVVELKPTPATGYAGEEFTIAVRTDRPADAVTLRMDGTNYAMEGSGTNWNLKRNIPDIGKKEFTAIAKNVEGAEGASKSGELLAKKSPLPVADVAAADVNVVSPGKGYAGDSYAFKVKTTAPSDAVFVDIEGKRYDMTGSGTDWTYSAKVDKVGISNYVVTARNKDGVLGKTGDGQIRTKKKPSVPVNVLTASVDPKVGYGDKKFTFQAKTDRPARAVTVVIGEDRFNMKGSGTDWSLSRQIDGSGAMNFSVVARNKDGAIGSPRTGTLTVYKERFKQNRDGTVTDLLTGKTRSRFVDNGDGTVTDLVTSLMWLRSPKQIALAWDDAVEYCRDLAFAGHKGWRLPTLGEWKKITDPKRKNPALPAGNPFANIPTHMGYWSKTKHKFGPKYVWQVSMWTGKTSHLKKEENAIAWPIRYAEIPE